MQRPSPVDPARQDLGIYSDMVMVPQPLGLSGPMEQGHLMTMEIHTTVPLQTIPQRNYEVDR